MNLKFESFLILSLIWSFPKFSNSYDIYRIMEWKFSIFDPSQIIIDLIDKKMLQKNELDKNFIYNITDLGKNNVNEYFKIKEIEIHEKFKSEEFLKVFFYKLKDEIIEYDSI